ncbi:serine kinase [Halovulum dunhuangense]|uniref:Serine kinase n=1 Tax=Halovulum dunhuangense TaxID=1505036 RepID=A0A849L5Z8_9RHOB|nr:HPr kinase/phosphatase C-terminal domain-containing protein [Halovulum dunhuangense]NNU81541.1 serine kinase [Halovulum dunhuangense]
MSDGPALLHATCVALDDRAVLLTGPSGSGKSTVALRMMALGATLVADDQVLLSAHGSKLRAEAPERIAGMIEMRGIGLVRVHHAPAAWVGLVADLSRAEVSRMPRLQKTFINRIELPLIAGRERPNLADMLVVCLRDGLDPLFVDPEG